MADNIFNPNDLDLDLDNLDKKKSNSSQKKSSTKKDDNISNSPKKDDKKNIFIENTKAPKKEEKKEISDEVIKTTLTDKSLLPEEIRKKQELEEQEEKRLQREKELQEKQAKKIIYDINISKISDLTKILIEKNYNFFTIEPTDTYAKITFYDEKNTKKEEKFIKLPDYFSIVTETKSIAKLKTDTTHLEQKWNWEISFKDNKYNFITKIVPSTNGEKVFVKLKLKQKKAWIRKKQPISLWKALSYLGIILFLLVLFAWIFLSFILFNSNSVADLNFFKNTFWIDANSIRVFIKQLVSIVFIILVFIESIFLISFVLKAFLAKKDKAKRISFSILSIFLTIILITTLFTWLSLYKKIWELKWLDYWKTIVYDNDMLVSKIFDKNDAKIINKQFIIWPISVEYDISEYLKQVRDQNITPTKVIWHFWDWKTVDLSPNIVKQIHKYTKKWVKRWYIEVYWINLKQEKLKKPLTTKLKELNIQYIVKISQKDVPWGWKRYIFDWSSLDSLWDLEWIVVENIEWKTKEEIAKLFDEALKNPFKGKKYFSRVIKWKLLVALKTSKVKDLKFFILDAWEESGISWDIDYQQDLDNEKKFTFIVKNPKTENGNWVIEKVIWEISWEWDNIRKEIKIPLSSTNNEKDLEKQTKFTYNFKKFWEKEVKAILYDSTWKQKTLKPVKITLKQKPQLKDNLKIIDEDSWEELKNIIYNKNINTYIIKKLKVPTKLIFDARNVTNKNYNYHLDSVEFDLDWDGDFETLWEKKVEKFFPIEKYYNIKVKYIFKHNNSNKTEELIEKINVNALAKDWLPHLEVKKSSEYAPSEVGFDASQSKVNWENIVEFAYDYWDWTPVDKTDAKVTHIYYEAWHYKVKLTITTDKWNKYETTTMVIIKPTASEVKIESSLNKAPIFQEIDFSSEKSTWNIASYLWDFWDWTTSTKANPTHFYKKAWKYKVKLTIIFANHNKKSNFKTIEITD